MADTHKNTHTHKEANDRELYKNNAALNTFSIIINSKKKKKLYGTDLRTDVCCKKKIQ